jgi:hypothetical protein
MIKIISTVTDELNWGSRVYGIQEIYVSISQAFGYQRKKIY